ncbi:LysM peptidoglycan-binding domain-containing protein [Fusibacter sp. JL298sf-3]
MHKVFVDGYCLPVAPSKIETKTKDNNQTETLLDGGEISLLRAPGLTTVSFNALIPAFDYRFAYYENKVFLPPTHFLQVFEDLKLSRKPFRLIISRVTPYGGLFETNMWVSLDAYAYTESRDNGDDLMFTLKFKQYRAPTVYTVTKDPESGEASAENKGAQRPTKDKPSSVTVKKGDTLWRICKKALGDGAAYKRVAKLNGIANPNLIYPGQVIRFE